MAHKSALSPLLHSPKILQERRPERGDTLE
jgi:hypothetical protein